MLFIAEFSGVYLPGYALVNAPTQDAALHQVNMLLDREHVRVGQDRHISLKRTNVHNNPSSSMLISNGDY